MCAKNTSGRTQQSENKEGLGEDLSGQGWGRLT
jgi:hypothetical protein